MIRVAPSLFNATVLAQPDITSSSSAESLSIVAQSNVGAGDSGDLILASGQTTGSNNAGNISLQPGGVELISLEGYPNFGNVVFTNTTVPITISLITQPANNTPTVGNLLTVQGQTGSSGISGDVNGAAGGGLLLEAGNGGLKSGSGTNGGGGSIVINSGSAGGVGANAGVITFQSGTSNVMSLAQSGIELFPGIVNIGGGLSILSFAQYKYPYLEVTGSLGSNAVIQFPTNDGSLWLVDTNQVVFNGYTVSFKANGVTSGVVGTAGDEYIVYYSGNKGALYIIDMAVTGGGGSGITALTADVLATGPGSAAATVVALQHNAVKSQSLGAAQDGYVLTWVNADGEWEAEPGTEQIIAVYGNAFTSTSTSLAVSGSYIQVPLSSHSSAFTNVSFSSNNIVLVASAAVRVTGLFSAYNLATQGLTLQLHQNGSAIAYSIASNGDELTVDTLVYGLAGDTFGLYVVGNGLAFPTTFTGASLTVMSAGGGSAGSNVTWAGDLAGSTNTNQTVVSVSGDVAGVLNIGDAVTTSSIVLGNSGASPGITLGNGAGSVIIPNLSGYTDTFVLANNAGQLINTSSNLLYDTFSQAISAIQMNTTLNWVSAATNPPTITQLAQAANNTPTVGDLLTLKSQDGSSAISGNTNGAAGGGVYVIAGSGGVKTGSGTNGGGGSLIFSSGMAGGVGASPGIITFQSATSNVLSLAQSGIELFPGVVSVSTGTTVLSFVQYKYPYLQVSGTMSGNCVIQFPTNDGSLWFVDTNQVVFNGYTISFKANGVTSGVVSGAGDEYQIYYSGNAGKLFVLDMAAGGGSGITALSGDVSATGPGSVAATVEGIQGISVPSPTGTNSVLTYNSGTYTWAPNGGGGTYLLVGTATAHQTSTGWVSWAVPATAHMVSIMCGGAGAGGGGGSYEPTTPGGGGGGGSGAMSRLVVPASALPSTIYLLACVGGAGGAGATSTVGSTGGAGSISYVSDQTGIVAAADLILQSGNVAATGGGGGSTSVGAAGVGETVFTTPSAASLFSISILQSFAGGGGGAGGAGSTSSNGSPGTNVVWSAAGSFGMGGPGGGGGTAAISGPPFHSGGAGGDMTGAGLVSTVTGGVAGNNHSTQPGNGTNGNYNLGGAQAFSAWTGSGGGGGSDYVNFNGGTGGTGGISCGGAGGGGMGNSGGTVTGGAGGNGGPGFIYIVWW